MKKKLVIYGAGGLGREVLASLRNTDEWEILGFVDDGLTKETSVDGLSVVGGTDTLNSYDAPLALVIAVGDPKVKARIRNTITNPLIHFPTLIHPSVIILNADNVKIGAGTIICAGTVVTTNVNIGEHVLLNLNCTVGHDVEIGNFASIMPGVNISGNVTVGEMVLIGSGANLKNEVHVGDRGKIGMGATVINDVSNDTTVVGVPAKPVIK